MELREKEGLVRPACKQMPLPYHVAVVGSGNQGGFSVDRWRLVRLVVGAGGASDREGDGLGRWNSRCLRV